MDKKDNQSPSNTTNPSISNFFTQTQSSSTTDNTNSNNNNNNERSSSFSHQAFPPINNNNNNNNETGQLILNSPNSNYNQNNPQQTQTAQTQKTFLEKVNSTASGVLDFIKSKTPPIPSNIITKKILNNVDPLTILSDIKMESFEENIIKKTTKEIECLKLEKRLKINYYLYGN